MISRIDSDKNIIENLSKNARNLYESEYSYSKIYGSLVNKLEKLAKNEL